MHTIFRRLPLGVPVGDSRPPSLRVRISLFETLGWIADRLLTWQERASQRAHLASLDDRMLKDIGLSRADVLAESSRPFWRD